MAQENRQKIKLLKLHEYLRQETDEDHPLTTNQLCAILTDMDISCDRRTLAKDIALLNEEGIEVMSTWIGKEKAYYIEDRSFSLPELKILIDAVQASSFITKKKSDELIGKIADLGGSHKAEILKNNMVCFNTRKHTNEAIYYNVNTLEDALFRKKQIIFKYFDIDAKGNKIYRRDAHHYVAEPIALVFNEDNYYLVVYSSKYDNTTNYRVDKMSNVEILEDNISDKALALRGNIGNYTEQAFKMYSGTLTSVTIEFSNKLIGAVYDKFGEDIKIKSTTDDKCTATVRIQISPVFWGWLLQFAGDMKLTAPKSAIAQFKEHLSKIVV